MKSCQSKPDDIKNREGEAKLDTQQSQAKYSSQANSKWYFSHTNIPPTGTDDVTKHKIPDSRKNEWFSPALLQDPLLALCNKMSIYDIVIKCAGKF